MISFPQCKINIGLNIHFKRDDNFHEITSVMYPVPLNDVLEIVRSEEFKFSHSGLDIPGDTNNNLCIRAFKLMEERYSISPVHMHLYKKIPMGGGLGGGSADATETLKLLNDEFILDISNEELKEMAAELGSDCPFFVENNVQFAQGRGEKLNTIDLDLSGKYLLLVNDGTHVSTKEAYGNVVPTLPSERLLDLLKLPVHQWKGKVINQFEESVFQIYPHLEDLKNQLYNMGAVYASMSGSGATLYGLFDEEPNQKGLPVNLEFSKIIEL